MFTGIYKGRDSSIPARDQVTLVSDRLETSAWQPTEFVKSTFNRFIMVGLDTDCTDSVRVRQYSGLKLRGNLRLPYTQCLCHRLLIF